MHKMNTRKSAVLVRGRKRPRTSATLILFSSLFLHTTNGLASIAATHTRKVPPLPHTDPSHAIEKSNLLERLESMGYEEEDDDDEFVLDDEMLTIVQRVQQSTQADVLSSDEEALANVDTPESFLSQLGGTTHMEQVAMSSITEQLPQASLQAFTEKQDMHYSRQQRVTPEEEQHLGRLIQRGAEVMQVQSDNPKEWALAAGLSAKELRRTIVDYRRAKHVLVTANMGLVHAVVRDMPGNHQELVQEGSLGLLRAAELFDPTRGLRFSTYAVVWIKGMLSNTHVRELVKVPVRERQKWNKIRKAQQEWEKEHPDIPCRPEDVSKLTGFSAEEVAMAQRRYSQSQNMDSLDARINIHGRSGGLEGSIEQEVAVYDDEGLAESAQLQADLIAALTRNLDAREARLMRLRYGLSTGRDRTLQECAEAMGLSYSRVQQLNTRCMKKLRKADEVAALQEYLLTIA